jgi:hypothetical protein
MSRLKDWDFEIDWDQMQDTRTDELELNYPQSCTHEWTPIALIFTTVYDCKKCGKKKEDV